MEQIFEILEQNARATLSLASRIYVMENGRVAVHGPSQDFTTDRLRELYIT